MPRNAIFAALVAALFLSAGLAAEITQTVSEVAETETDAVGYAIMGANLTLTGAMSLAQGGYLSEDAEALVMKVAPPTYNLTILFVKQYAQSLNLTIEDVTSMAADLPAVEVESGVVGGLEAMSQGGMLVYSAASAIINMNETMFKATVNTTFFYTMQQIADNLIQLSDAVEDSFAAETVSTESTGNRKLLQSSSKCDKDSSDAELQQCFLESLSSTSDAMSANADATYSRQYDYYCKPNIKKTFSDDLDEDLDDDKTMKTCNDFSFFGMFGATRCSECISHSSEDVGGLLTQEDCKTTSSDEQKWYLDDMGDGKFMMRNEEEDKHCVTAPTSSSLYSSQYYTLQKCNATNKAQHFDALELDTLTGDPRIVMRLSGSDSKSLPGGMCMTTLEDDDDDDLPFISKPCICAKSQTIARDD